MECFLGEIRAFTFDYAPQYWALCNGASIPVAQNQALYSQGVLSNVGLWGPASNATALASQTIGASGSGSAHENRQPFLVMSYCISLEGTYPVPAD
jgi:microcystin-dependent protein